MIVSIYKLLSRGGLLTLLVSGLIFVLLSGNAFAANGYGKLDRDYSLEKMFLNFEVLQDYDYYTTGGYDVPNAILLIRKGYELDNPGNFWRLIPDVGYEQVRKWVSLIRSNEDMSRSYNYFAAYILDQSGQKVGVWYSFEDHPTIKFVEGKKILAYTPPLVQDFSILGGLDRF